MHAEAPSNGPDSPRTSKDRSAVDQQLLRDLIQEGLLCSTADGGTTQERREHEVTRFNTLIKVLVRACILDLPAKIATDGFDAVAIQARNTLAIIRRNVKLRPEILIFSAKESDEAAKVYPAVALYQWLIPRLLHAASQVDGTTDERDFRGDVLDCAVDIIKGLMADMGPEHVNSGYSSVYTAIHCLGETSQGANANTARCEHSSCQRPFRSARAGGQGLSAGVLCQAGLVSAASAA